MAFWCYGKNNFCDNNSLCPEGCEYFDGSGGEEREVLENLNDAVNDTPRWISVKDKLPPFGEVLICTVGNWIGVACHHGEGRFVTGSGLRLTMDGVLRVSHWQPLPEPPRKEG